MNILGIDTSFDDTAASVMCDDQVKSNIVVSSILQHQAYGGVVPRLARTTHEKYIDLVIQKALAKARLEAKDLSAIAVTYGPGLSIALEVGISKAKSLADQFNLPLIGVNHMEGHLLSFLVGRKTIPTYSLPALGVLISGGHTQLILVSNIGEYQILGETQDDAMGEAYDKVGRMLGIPYPAGAALEKLALLGVPGAYTLPIPMRMVSNAHTSFSGLKTAVTRLINEQININKGTLTHQQIYNIALAFQTSAIQHLQDKIIFCLKSNPKISSIFVGGGVAANLTLRESLRKLARLQKQNIYFPISKKYCLDNAAMIAMAGYFALKHGRVYQDAQTLDREPNLKLR